MSDDGRNWLSRWYEENTTGLTRQRLAIGAWGVLVVMLFVGIGAAIRWCATL